MKDSDSLASLKEKVYSSIASRASCNVPDIKDDLVADFMKLKGVSCADVPSTIYALIRELRDEGRVVLDDGAFLGRRWFPSYKAVQDDKPLVVSGE